MHYKLKESHVAEYRDASALFARESAALLFDLGICEKEITERQQVKLWIS